MRRFARSFVFAALASLFLATPIVSEETKYGVQNTFYFVLIDPAGVDFETAATCATGGGAADDDVQLIVDAAASVDATNCFVAEGDGLYSITLTAAELQAEKVAVMVIDQTATKVWLDHVILIDTYGDASAEHAVDRDSEPFERSQSTIVTGTVDNATFTPTTTQFETDITEATSGHFNGRVVIWTSGALQYQAVSITSYSLQNGKGFFTVSAMTEAPANNDTFVIL